MIITCIYLAGAWTGKWAFNPYWLGACVICDTALIDSIGGLIGVETTPLINIEANG